MVFLSLPRPIPKNAIIHTGFRSYLSLPIQSSLSAETQTQATKLVKKTNLPLLRLERHFQRKDHASKVRKMKPISETPKGPDKQDPFPLIHDARIVPYCLA